MKVTKIKLAIYLLNLTASIAFLFLLIYSLTSKKVMTNLFTYSSYYLILSIVLLWSVQTVLFLKALNFSLKGMVRKYWMGISIAFVLTSLVFASVRVQFKTLSDETNLLSISNSMLNNKTCVNSTMGKYYYGNLNIINNEIPKRPLVYPFLVHILHTLTGFRYQNAFVMNFIIMFLFLSGVYITSSKFLDAQSAVAAIFFILSYPVFTIFGTSGGFDLLSSVFFMMIIAITYHFIKRPSSVTFAFLFASLLVFSQTRYESMLFLFIIPLLLCKKIKWDYLKSCSYLFFITPLVSLPYIWQRILRHEAYQNPDGTPVFSISSLTDNLSVFFKNLVDLKYFLPYAGFLSIIGILIFIYLVLRFLINRKGLESYQRHFLIVLFVSVLLSTVIYFAHFFGVYTHPSSARLFITLSIILALAPVALKIAKPNFLSGTSLLIISVVCFIFYHPIAVEGRFINTLKGNRTTEHCMNFVSRLHDRNILVITLRPGQFVALGYGAVNFAYANTNKELVLLEASRRLFSKIIVFQEIEYESKQPTSETLLPSDYKLNTLYEIQISATEFLRISEVENYKPPPNQ